MNLTFRYLSIVCFVFSVSACVVQEGEESDNVASTDTLNNELDLPLLDDGLIAPAAPELSISAEPGVLQFSWVDRENPAGTETETELYQHDDRSGLEVQLDTNIDTGTTAFSLPVAPHQLAWDSVSYRVEICTSNNCLSSLRMPVGTLLSGAINVIQPGNADLFPGFATDLAINATGNVAIAANPEGINATVHFRQSDRWVLASTLTPTEIDQTAETVLRMSMSASGDTIAIASITATSNPNIAVFDRLGENWIQTDSISAFNSNLAQTAAEVWDTQSMRIALSANGDRLVVGAQHASLAAATPTTTNNRIDVFERAGVNWGVTANLNLPPQQTRLRSFSTSSAIDVVTALSASNGALFIHEYALVNGQWQELVIQQLNSIIPGRDSVIVSDTTASTVAVAGWEPENNNRRTAVAWKLERQNAGWVSVDSVRASSSADASAELRLAGDGELHNMAIGWQALLNANLDFFAPLNGRWQRLFSLPRALSVVFSTDNSSALVGASGGFFALSAND